MGKHSKHLDEMEIESAKPPNLKKSKKRKSDNMESPSDDSRNLMGNQEQAEKKKKKKKKSHSERSYKEEESYELKEAAGKKHKASSNDQPENGSVSQTPTKKSKVKQVIIKEELEEEEDVIDHHIATDDEEEIDEVVDDSKPKSGKPMLPLEDLPTLVEKIVATLPEPDTLASRTRSKKLRWDKIAFKDYTAEQCRETWELIMKKHRQYRLLTEVIADVREWLKKPWKDYKGGKHKDHPDLPKKPLSGYMLFFMEKQNELMKENPGTKVTEFSRSIAQSYKELSEKKRNFYAGLAAERKVLYEHELQKFYQKHPDLRKTVEIKPPKKPCTPFTLYCEDLMSQVDSLDDKYAFKEECKGKWKTLSDEQKVHFINNAIVLQEKYQKELKEYQMKYPEYTTTTKDVLTRDERQLLEKMNGKPEKPPTTGYMLFVKKYTKKHLDEMKDLPPKDRLKICSQKWQLLSGDERKQYNNKVEKLMNKYKTEYAEYLKTLPPSERESELKKTPKKLRDDPGVMDSALVEVATPQAWSVMAESEKVIYMKYLQKMKDFFDAQHKPDDEENGKHLPQLPSINDNEEEIDDEEEEDEEEEEEEEDEEEDD